MRTLIFPARFDQLESVRQFTTQAAADAGLDEQSICSVEMAVDEACSNIIEHAYEGISGGEIECTCDYNPKSFTVILRDHGRSFDILKVPAPDLNAGLEERQVGGLGIYLMRQLMDEVQYEHLGEAGNVLTMIKRLKKAK
jgi:serine/threonine-protein kinase RsbW